jgi:hypothetical protein
MSPKLVINAIETTVLSMSELDDRQKWQSYGTIRNLANELFRWSEMHGDSQMKVVLPKVLADLMAGASALAGLSELYDSQWGLMQAKVAISNLRHPHLFGRAMEL